MKRIIPLGFVFCFVSSLLWISPAKGEDYYPLKEGRTWEYQVSNARTIKVVMTNYAPRELKGKKVVPQKMTFLNQSGFSFITEDSSGIYEFASQGPGDVEPEIRSTPDYIIKYPIKVGTTWHHEAETSLLKEKASLTVKSTIESVDEAVTVPAGTFKGCVKVRARGATKKKQLGGGALGDANISIERYEWFASGVGRIRLIVKEERRDRVFVDSGQMNWQLKSFKK